MRDFQFAFRVLIKSKGATIVAVLALALGIGGNVGTFVFVDALVLNPLPYPNAEQIMTVWETAAKVETERTPVAPGNFLDWKEQSSAFAELAAHRQWNVNLTTAGAAEPVRASRVSASFFGRADYSRRLPRRKAAAPPVGRVRLTSGQRS